MEQWWFENNHTQEILKNKVMLLQDCDCEECNILICCKLKKKHASCGTKIKDNIEKINGKNI